MATISRESSFTRFSAGPAPDTSNILWKANITGIQPYIAAFDGLIFVGTNTSMVAIDQTGKIVWRHGNSPQQNMANRLRNRLLTHHSCEGSCLNPQTGKILWTSSHLALTQEFSTASLQPRSKKCFTLKLIRIFKLGIFPILLIRQLWLGKLTFRAGT